MNKYTQYSLIAVISALTLTFLLHTTANFLYDRALAQITPEDYLANLRENSEFGCHTALKNKSEILVISNSLGYTGIQFNKMAELLKTNSISSCTMGGLYIETVPDILKALRDKKKLPHTLVYGITMHQLTQTSTKDEQILQQKHLLSSLKPTLLRSQKIVREYIFGESFFPRSYQNDQNLLASEGRQIESLNDQAILQKMSSVPFYLKAFKEMYPQPLKMTSGIKESIDSICSYVETEHTNLYVVNLPENPFFEKLHTLDDLREYRSIMSLFKKCAVSVVMDRSEDYGIGPKHFLNRQMSHDYDYQQWSDSVSKTAILDQDLGHYNLVGANLFTPLALKKLALIKNSGLTIIKTDIGKK